MEKLVNRTLRSALSAFHPGDGEQDGGGPATAAPQEPVWRPATFQTLVELGSRHDGFDKDFADDLEQIQRDQRQLDENPWDS